MIAGVGLAALLLGAATASWSPEIGREELRSAPAFIGMALVFILGGAELLALTFRSRLVSATATTAVLLAAAICALRVWIAFFTPARYRDIQTWHLWPLFTVM